MNGKKLSIRIISAFVIMLLLSAMLIAPSASAASQVKIGKAHYSVQIGDTKKIDATGTNLRWQSSNTNVVRVSSAGFITGVSMGRATVTASNGSWSASCEVTCGYYKGIDVSTWNRDYTGGNGSSVDWKKVKADGIDFAIIRAGYGWEDYPNQMDNQFLNNIRGCVENDIPFGLYFYSYAANTYQASLEANYLLRILRDYAPQYMDKITLPIAYDLEEEFMYTMNSKVFTDIIITFSNAIKAAGFDAMVYGNSGTFYNMDIRRLQANNISFWYAMWPNNPNFSRPETIGQTGVVPEIWQYASDGTVNGAGYANGVDVNALYMLTATKSNFKGTQTSSTVASQGSNSAVLRWSAVDGAGYNLYRCELNSAGAMDTSKRRWLYSGAKTSFTDSSMVYGKGYYYYTDTFFKGDFLDKDYQKVVGGSQKGTYVYNVYNGDCDLDSKITLKDAVLSQKMAVSSVSVNSVQRYAADMDKNNVVNLADAVKIQKLALN